MLAGLLLAQAGMHDGLHVVQTQSYGPEARLGAAKSDVLLSSHEIAFPEVVEPDLLLCLSRDAYVTYGGRLAEGGRRVVDEPLTRELAVGDDLVLPLSRRATEVGDPLVANVVALGALVALRDVVSRDALRRAVRERVRPQFQELNLSALDVGFRLGAEASRPALA
jgi:2-oxoglutarate ferredoxin oxidoreductase subunit gamma